MEINIKIVEKRNQKDIVRLIDAGISLKNTNKSQVILTELYPEYLKSDNMPSCDEITIPASNEENEEGVRVIEKFQLLVYPHNITNTFLQSQDILMRMGKKNAIIWIVIFSGSIFIISCRNF